MFNLIERGYCILTGAETFHVTATFFNFVNQAESSIQDKSSHIISPSYLARPIFACFKKKQRLSCSFCSSCLRRSLPFLSHLCKVTFDIPEAYFRAAQSIILDENFCKNS